MGNVWCNEINHVMMANAIIGYFVEYKCVPDVIVSIGCGWAMEFPIFARLLPSVRRIGVDALDRFASHVQGEFINALCLHQPLPFFRRIHGPSEASTVYKCNLDAKYRQVACNHVTLDGIWTQCELTGKSVFLWLDAEGSEQDIMRSGPSALPDCTHVLTEVCGDTPGRVSSEQMRQFMVEKGYYLVHTFNNKTSVEIHFYERKTKR